MCLVFSDPDDDSGRYESVSPENMFSQRAERFGAIEGADHVVSSSMKWERDRVDITSHSLGRLRND